MSRTKWMSNFVLGCVGLITLSASALAQSPARDNAIYQFAGGLARLAKFEFPFKLSDTTRTHFERRAAMESKGINSATAADMRPGVPEIPTMTTGGTDGRLLNNVGSWTYGVSGIFTPPEGSNAHRLNEKLPVKSQYEGHEFLWRLGKALK